MMASIYRYYYVRNQKLEAISSRKLNHSKPKNEKLKKKYIGT